MTQYAGRRQFNYELAKTTTSYSKDKKPYQVCTSKTCRGWEYVANHKDECMVCGSPLSRPPPRQRPRTPRAQRRQPSADTQSKDGGSSLGDELLALLQAQLPKHSKTNVLSSQNSSRMPCQQRQFQFLQQSFMMPKLRARSPLRLCRQQHNVNKKQQSFPGIFGTKSQSSRLPKRPCFCKGQL